MSKAPAAEPVSDSRAKKIGILLVLSLTLAIIVIDSTVLNVSIANLIKDLNTDIQSIQWVISIYSLVLGAFTITGGRLGDLLGRKKMFIAGAVVFAIGSLIASFSQNVTTLLLGWSVVEGIGAALMMPATSSLLISNFKGRERALAFGVWGGVAAAAAAIGPIFGGFLTTNVSWHWAFRINVVIVFILIAGSVLIKESRDTKEKSELDIVGVFLSSISLFLIVFGIIQSSTYGWLQAKKPFDLFGSSIDFGGISVVPIAIILGTILLAIFGWWQNKREKAGHTPLVSLHLFTNRQFSSGVLTTMILALGQAGLIFAIPIFLQSVRQLSAFETGIALLPLSLALLVTAPLSAYLSHKITPKNLVLVGLVINFISLIVLQASITTDATATSLIPGLLLYGAGMGLVMAQINNITLSAVQVYQAGEASGVNATVRQIGSTLGSAVIGAVFLSAFTATLITGVNNSTVVPNAAKEQVVQKVEDAGSNLEFGGAQELSNAKLPPVIVEEFTKLTNQSTVSGNKDALTITALFTILGMLTALFLPNTKNIDRTTDTVAASH